MIEMSCPSCGRAGQVPPEKLHTRLVCRKCHVVFHMEPSGRPVLGEPPGSKDLKKEAKEKKSERPSAFEGLQLPSLSDLTNIQNNFSDGNFPVKPALGVLGGIVVLWGIYGFLNGPPEAVADRAR